MFKNCETPNDNQEMQAKVGTVDELIRNLLSHAKQGLSWTPVYNDGNRSCFMLKTSVPILDVYDDDATLVLQNLSTEEYENFTLHLVRGKETMFLAQEMTLRDSESTNELAELYYTLAENVRKVSQGTKLAHIRCLIKKETHYNTAFRPTTEENQGTDLLLRDLFEAPEAIARQYLDVLVESNRALFDGGILNRPAFEKLAESTLSLLTSCARTPNKYFYFDMTYSGLRKRFHLASGRTCLCSELLEQDCIEIDLTNAPLHLLANVRVMLGDDSDEYKNAIAVLVFAKIMERYL